MKYYVDSMKIEEFINNCNGYINELIEESKIMRGLINETVWKGNAYEAALLKYNNIMNEIDEVSQKLNLYTKFMEIVIKNYGEGTEKLQKEFQTLIERLELEKKKNEL